MKFSKRMLFGIIACALAFLLVIVGIPLINTASDPQIKIVRAIADIEKGTPITADKIAYVDVSSTGLPEVVITNAADVLDKYALVDIVAGDYFLPTKISGYKPVDASIYTILEDGMVAVTIDAPSFAGTLANKVQIGDIVSFYSVSGASTVFELQYVRIAELLTNDGTSVEDIPLNASDEENGISAITFAVTKQQADALLKLQYGGDVHFELVCRNDPERAEMLLAKQQAMIERLDEAHNDIIDSYLKLFDETYNPDSQTLPQWYERNIGMTFEEATVWIDVMENYDNQSEDPLERMEADRTFYLALIETKFSGFAYEDLVDWITWEEEWLSDWEAEHASGIGSIFGFGTEESEG